MLRTGWNWLCRLWDWLHMADEFDQLERAARRVAQARGAVARQRQIVDELKTLGCSAVKHELMLQLHANSLRTLEEHEKELRKRLGVHSEPVTGLNVQPGH